MKNLRNTISLWLGSLMIFVVLAGAIALTLTDFWNDRLYGNKRTGFIVMLFAYAVYRTFRLRSLLKSRDAHAD